MEEEMMSNKRKYLFGLLVFSLSCCVPLPSLNAGQKYPNFKDNHLLTSSMRTRIAPHLLPLDHPMKPKLDAIFSQSRVLESPRTFADAGFEIIAGPMQFSYVIVARHPEVPGYVFKLYLDSAKRSRHGVPHWKWLVRRCEGAKGIRNIIKRKKIQHFVIPDKWLYVLPTYPFAKVSKPETVVLMETDMELVHNHTTMEKWRTEVTREHLDELYSILKHGYAGASTRNLYANVLHTQHGKFAFTDTEDPKRKVSLRVLQKFFSPEMAKYWLSIVKE
jgi:hypothetical protein